MSFTRNSCDVVIAGAGIAASATALRLCALGFRPLILARRGRDIPGVEAIPEAALPLFIELGAEGILPEAGGVTVDGFENHWDQDRPSKRSGRWIHVERDRLAKAALRAALERGARFRTCQNLPRLRVEPDCVSLACDGTLLRFDVAIDATGRSAAWSRPSCRRGVQVADIYDVPPNDRPVSARVARMTAGWAYRIGTRNRASVGMLSEGRRRYSPDDLAARQFSFSSGSHSFVGRRPAFVQWCDNPVGSRRLAVGDAALAYDPLAGQGIRFALSSAITASTVVNTWSKTPSQSSAAERFYRKYVLRSRDNHLRMIDQLRTGSAPPEQSLETNPEFVTFSGEFVPAELQLNSTIYADTAFLLPDGDCVRWVGGVDLLALRTLLPQTARSSDLVERLSPITGGPVRAQTLMQWCLRNKILRAASA